MTGGETLRDDLLAVAESAALHAFVAQCAARRAAVLSPDHPATAAARQAAEEARSARGDAERAALAHHAVAACDAAKTWATKAKALADNAVSGIPLAEQIEGLRRETERLTDIADDEARSGGERGDARAEAAAFRATLAALRRHRLWTMGDRPR